MRNLITLLFLLFTINSSSQTRTEKWNSSNQRYEYFNSNGTMIGYKKFNNLYERWDYYDLKTTNTNSNNGYQVQQPPSYGDLKILERTLDAKQQSYNNNKKRIDDFIKEQYSILSDYHDNASNACVSKVRIFMFNDFATLVEKYRSEGYDLSSNSLTEKIIIWFSNGITNIINEGKIKEKKCAQTNLLSLKGGYNVSKIDDQILQNGKWNTIKTETYNSFLYFNEDILWFKRGNDEWAVRKLIFKTYDKNNKVNLYDTMYGLTAIDESNKYIVFYDMEGSNKRYIYTIGTQNKSITIAQ